MEARIREEARASRAVNEARVARQARIIARVTNGRSEPSIAEPPTHTQELIEEGDLDSATEEDIGALGCADSGPIFSSRRGLA